MMPLLPGEKKTECPWKAKKDKNFYPQGNARGDDHAELFHNQQQVRNGEVQVLEIKTWILSLEKEKALFQVSVKAPGRLQLNGNEHVNIFPNPHCHSHCL